MKLSRREAALLALAARAMADTPEKQPYTGALDGEASKVDLTAFDPIAYGMKRYRSAPLKMTFQPGSQAQNLAWQKKLRTKITELLGGFPDQRVPLKPVTLETKEFPRWTREKFVIQTRDGMMSLAYLVLPKDAPKPVPTVVCVPGHGRGVDDLVGIDEQGNERTTREGYQFDFALQAAEHGMAAVAVEPLAFGCRRDPKARSKGLKESSCQPAAGIALMLGETMIGWRVYDVMRTIDWIETRPELDAKRVGCMGISGGGTCTLFSTALEPRIKAALVSGYLNTFRDSIMSMSHCIDNYVPGILNWAEMYDVATLIAPRPLFAESGTKDNIFPIAASNESFARVKGAYEAFGAGDMVGHEVFEGAHQFSGREGLPFLAKMLGAKQA